MEQRAIIVKDSAMRSGLNSLNELLSTGDWKVVSMCPMPSGVGGDSRIDKDGSCLVIAEKIKR